MFVSETFSITDAIYYGNNTFSGKTLTLPSSFTISFKGSISANNGNVFVLLWYGTANAIGFGKIEANGQMALADYVNGWQNQNFGSMPLNTEKTFEYSYSNGVHTLTIDGVSKTISKSISVSKIDFQNNANGTVSDLIIKPL